MRTFDPAHRIVLDVPGMSDVVRERVDLPAGLIPTSVADLYRPVDVGQDGRLRPAVLFIHGDADPGTLRGIADWGQYRSWGQATAATGIIAVIFEHASTEGLTRMRGVLREIEAMLAFLRSDGPRLGIDPDRIGIWTCSAGAPYGAAAALRAGPPVRCLVAYYGFLDLRHLRNEVDPMVSDDDLAAASPAAIVQQVDSLPPTLIARAGLDRPQINDSIDRYLAAVSGRQPPAQVLTHLAGRHAFDVLDEDDTSRSIISATLEFMKRTVAEPGPAPWKVTSDPMEDRAD